MGKATLSWLAVTLTLAGMAVITGHPAWGTVTGGAILILAAGAAAGAVRTKSERRIEERKVTGKKISNSLVTLSSAAILAVYAAGYQRTRAAADKFEAQTARRKAAASISATVVTPAAALPGIETSPSVPGSSAPPLKKNRPRSSSTTARSATVRKTEPTPADSSQATPTAPPTVETAADPTAEPAAPPAVAKQIQYKDGTYLGWGYSRHGDIQASVVILDGQIASTAIAVCATRYTCAWITPLLDQVVTRQSPNVHHISGATDSSNAFSDAVAAALSKASE